MVCWWSFVSSLQGLSTWVGLYDLLRSYSFLSFLVVVIVEFVTKFYCLFPRFPVIMLVRSQKFVIRHYCLHIYAVGFFYFLFMTYGSTWAGGGRLCPRYRASRLGRRFV